MDRLEEALEWYNLCLTINPRDAGLHANIGFTLHLSGRFDDAITAYHQSLALQHTPFCAEMLSRAMRDFVTYATVEDMVGFDVSRREGDANHLDFGDALGDSI